MKHEVENSVLLALPRAGESAAEKSDLCRALPLVGSLLRREAMCASSPEKARWFLCVLDEVESEFQTRYEPLVPPMEVR